jgi:hypothetical protein
VHFVVYAPVGTAVFHLLNEGWTADTHQLTTLIDIGNALFWSKTAGRAGEESRAQTETECRRPRQGSLKCPLLRFRR